MRLASLTSRMLGICTGSLIIMFLACLYSFLQTVASEERKIHDNWYQDVRQMEASIGAQFFERYGDVQAWALNTVMHTRNAAEITKALNAYISIYSVYDLILLVDMNGQVIATSSVDPSNNSLDSQALAEVTRQNFAQAPWFTNVVNERFTEDTHKGFTGTYVEDIMIDPVTTKTYRKKQIGLSFSAPVRDENGKMIAVMTSRSSLRWIEYSFTQLYAELKKEGLEATDLNLLNRKGEVLIHYEPALQNGHDAIVHDFDHTLFKLNLVALHDVAAVAASRGEEGTRLAPHTRRGTMYLNAFKPLSGPRFVNELGWLLVFRAPEEALLGRVIMARQNFFLISGVVLAFCLLFSGYFAIRLSRRLKQISENIAASGGTVDSVAAQLSGASHDLSSGATEVASSLQETVSSLEELTSMVRANAENAGEAASLAQNSSRIAKEGESEVQNLIGAISEIDQSSKKIEEIISVIDDIAFQTNLLALNAAVEAARAGDQGKGFAVVAEAVRNLAQRSGSAAKEITGLIRDNVAKIDRGTKIADRSGQVLQNILASVRKVADLSNEIAAASKEQSSGLSQISKAMNEIDQATQRNAAASEEVAASAEEMNAQARGLQAMVLELSSVITGTKALAPTLSHRIPSATVLPMKRPVQRSVSQARKTRSPAEVAIPFGEDDDAEPAPRISNTAGF